VVGPSYGRRGKVFEASAIDESCGSSDIPRLSRVHKERDRLSSFDPMLFQASVRLDFGVGFRTSESLWGNLVELRVSLNVGSAGLSGSTQGRWSLSDGAAISSSFLCRAANAHSSSRWFQAEPFP
jgi:hypothetical protein